MSSFTVPPEVAYRIARAVTHRQTLAILARTSRSLRDQAERLLYEYIEIFPHPCHFHLLETLAESPRQAAYVRHYALTMAVPYRMPPIAERELKNTMQRISLRREFWERVSASLAFLMDLDTFHIVDSRLSQSWILDSAVCMSVAELRLHMAWDEHVAKFVHRQDQLRSLQISNIAENVPLAALPPNSLPCLTMFEGPLMLVELLLHCPLTHLKTSLDTEESISLLPFVLAELHHLKELRSLSINMLPTEEVLSALSAIATSCPNLQLLAHIPLPIDHTEHLSMISYLSNLPHLRVIEFDILHWNPPLTPAFQRTVAASIHMVLPKLRYVFFWARYDRTIWTWAPEEVEPIQVAPQQSQLAFPAVAFEDQGDEMDLEGTGYDYGGAGQFGGAGAGPGGAGTLSEETTSYVGLEGWKHQWGTTQRYMSSTAWKTAV